MLKAMLRAPLSTNNVRIASDFLRMVGPALFDASGKQVAEHKTGFWSSEGRTFLAIEFEGEVELKFEHPEFKERDTVRPLANVQIINGNVWAGTPPQLIAHFDDVLHLWHIDLRPNIAMPQLTVSPLERHA